MSNFNDAARALKAQISAIGGKDYSYSVSWLTSPAQHPNYTDNALQAVWNIADILQKATTASNIISSLAVLAYYKSTLSSCFDYLEKGTGVLRIIDIKTYHLGRDLHHLFHVLVNDHKIKKLIPTKELKKLEEIYTSLGQRVLEFKQHSKTRLTRYKAHLELDLHFHRSLPSPDFINADTKTYDYNISLSTAVDHHLRALEDKDTYINLIALLEKYEDELTQHERRLEEALDHFISNKHPLPRHEDEVFYEEFSSAREATFLSIKEKHQRAKDERLQINTLLAKAIAEHQTISHLLARLIVATENEIEQIPTTPISPLPQAKKDIPAPLHLPLQETVAPKTVRKPQVSEKIKKTPIRLKPTPPAPPKLTAVNIQAPVTIKTTTISTESKKIPKVKKQKVRKNTIRTSLRCSFLPPPPTTNIQTLDRVKTEFFGNEPMKISGVFGDYLKERAKTFWLSDLILQFGSLLFGLFNYKTESQQRNEYILNLQANLISYQSNNINYESLSDSITKGILNFHPRSLLRPEYQKSLQCKLFEFKHQLEAIHLDDEEKVAWLLATGVSQN